MLLTVVGRHNHCEWLVVLLLDLLQVATLDVAEHLRDLLVLDVAELIQLRLSAWQSLVEYKD